MQGKRHDYTENDIPQPGEYGKDAIGNWYGAAPVELDSNGFPMVADLSNHTVAEHEDGSITVSPSILISDYEGDKIVRQWHGFLERGVWREV